MTLFNPSRLRAGCEQGLVIPLFALGIFSILVMAAIVVDIGRTRVLSQFLQNIADSTAHTGAHYLWGFTTPTAKIFPMSQLMLQTHNFQGTSSIEIGRYDPVSTNFYPYAQASAAPWSPRIVNGVGEQAWANAIRVNVSQSKSMLLASVFGRNVLNVSASSTVTYDLPEAQCVAPFVIPVCGLVYEADSGGFKAGDFHQSTAWFQEIIFGPLPNPLSYPSQVQLHAAPNNPLSTHSHLFPPLNPGLGIHDLFPLRGGFGRPGMTANSGDIVGILESPRGCVKARLGERVAILEGGLSSSQFDARRANRRVAELINDTTPSMYHNDDFFDDPPLPTFIDPGASDPGACPAAPGRIPCSNFPNGRGGCHTAGAPYDPGPAVTYTNHWEVKVAVIAPTRNGSTPSSNQPGLDYCEANTPVNNASNPVIVGFLSVYMFDTQLPKPGTCEWVHPCCTIVNDACVPGSGWVPQQSCEGVRAKPSGYTGPLSGSSYRNLQRQAVVK